MSETPDTPICRHCGGGMTCRHCDEELKQRIVAADLYEALEQLMSVPIVADYAGDNVHLDAAISAARAALSRAKGETTSPPPSDRATTDKREGG